MNENVITALASVLGMFITGGFGYLVARNNNKKDLSINDRQLLSEDERQFRQELKTELANNRKEIEGLRLEVENLRALNLNLELENKQLQIKVDELRQALQGRWDKSDRA